MHVKIRLVSIVSALALMAAFIMNCNETLADPPTIASAPIALSGAAHAADQYGPNLGTASFTDLSSPNPAISRTGTGGIGTVIYRADTDAWTASVNPGAGGLWLWHGTNNLAVKYTDPAPVTGSYTTSGFNNGIVNSAGQFAFRDNTGAAGGLYANPGVMGRLLKTTDVAPGAGGATFSSFGNLMNLNASGNASTLAGLTGTGVVTAAGPTQNNNGFWAGTPGSLSLLVRQSDQLNGPGNVAIPNVLVGSLDTSAYAFNDSGRLLFTGAMQGTGVNTTGGTTTGTNQGLMSTRNGYAEVIARRGDSFPDSSGAPFTSGTATDGVAYRSVTTSTGTDMNNAGHVVYSSSLRTSAGAVPTTNGTAALFSDNSGTNKTIARETFNLPAMSNLATGLKWGSSYSLAAINATDTIAFTATGLTGTDPVTNLTVTSAANSGLFKMDSSGAMTKVLRSGDSAPAWSAVSGNPALGQVVANANPVFSGTPGNFAMNALGQMSFVEGLTGTGIVSGLVGNNSGLFVVDTDGSISLIAQKGMLFHVGPGDDRIVCSSGLGPIATTGNQDGRASNLDDYGNLAFSLQFCDAVGGAVISQGVFYTHIPEPGTLTLLAAGLLAAARRRRGRA